MVILLSFLYTLLCIIVLIICICFLNLTFPKRKLVLKIIFSIIIIIIAESPIISYYTSGDIRRIFSIICNYYLGLILILAIVSIILLIVFLIIKISTEAKKQVIYKLWFISTIVIGNIVCIYGIIHADITHIKKYSVNPNSNQFINIVLLSDIHLGYSTDANFVKKMVDDINTFDSDIVIFAGDIFDNQISNLMNPDKMIYELNRIKSRYGVYGVYGNHDTAEKLFSGFSTCEKNEENAEDENMKLFLEKSNIRMLEDEYVYLNQSICLVGRMDQNRAYSLGYNRKKLSSILFDVKGDKKIIVIDHQPIGTEENEKQKVNLLLSGHTHNGQIFPANIFTKIKYDNTYGIKRYGSLYSITTSGYGVWGPNMRIGTNKEVVLIKFYY